MPKPKLFNCPITATKFEGRCDQVDCPYHTMLAKKPNGCWYGEKQVLKTYGKFKGLTNRQQIELDTYLTNVEERLLRTLKLKKYGEFLEDTTTDVPPEATH